MSTDFQTIVFTVKDNVARITLNRPQSLNSFTSQMHAELGAALDLVEEGGARCLLLGGAGRGFCSGQDLSELQVDGDGATDLGALLDRNYNVLIRRISTLPMPVVCAVNGIAAGAGANLALACDIVYAARSASFIQPFCRLGLVPDAGGTWVLPRLVGRARALALTLLGEKVSAEQAEQWGMIWKCVDDDQLAPATEKLAQHLATQPTRGLGYIKQALLSAGANTLDAQLDVERDIQKLAALSEDYREGVNAFLEKRAPKFRGM